MRVIPREAGRITYSTKIRNLKTRLKLNNLQKAIIVGSILGDAYLESNWSKTNYRFSIAHSNKQRAYILWKYSFLSDWVLTEPRYKEKTKSISFRTISHIEFTELRKIFYAGNKKIIPKNIEMFLKNPATIAVWFMDDGNKIIRKNKIYGYHLNTQSFSLKENLKIIDAFKKIYNIDFLAEKNGKKYRLRVMKKFSRDKFFNIIKSYIIESMKYKIS